MNENTNLYRTFELLATPYPKSERHDYVRAHVAQHVLAKAFGDHAIENLLKMDRWEMGEEFWVAAFEAMLVAKFAHADRCVSVILKKYPHECRADTRWLLVGLLRAAVWCERLSEVANPDFEKEFPYCLGELLKSQAEHLQENDKSTSWLIGQFTEALSVYLNHERQEYFDRASAILKPLLNVCMRGGAENKMLNELDGRLRYNLTPCARMNMHRQWHLRTHDEYGEIA